MLIRKKNLRNTDKKRFITTFHRLFTYSVLPGQKREKGKTDILHNFLNWDFSSYLVDARGGIVGT